MRKSLLLENLIQGFIRGVQVKVEHQRVRGVANLIEEMVVSLFHVIEVHGLVLQRVGVVVHELDFAVERAQQEQFGILQEFPLNAIDVGQLVAFRINLPVVGVAFGDSSGNIATSRLRDTPGVDHGQIRVGPASTVVRARAGLGLEKLHPSRQSGFLNHRVQVLGVVAGVELLDVMLGELHHV